jgi:hypothetical protein
LFTLLNPKFRNKNLTNYVQLKLDKIMRQSNPRKTEEEAKHTKYILLLLPSKEEDPPIEDPQNSEEE